MRLMSRAVIAAMSMKPDPDDWLGPQPEHLINGCPSGSREGPRPAAVGLSGQNAEASTCLRMSNARRWRRRRRRRRGDSGLGIIHGHWMVLPSATAQKTSWSMSASAAAAK